MAQKVSYTALIFFFCLQLIQAQNFKRLEFQSTIGLWGNKTNSESKYLLGNTLSETGYKNYYYTEVCSFYKKYPHLDKMGLERYTYNNSADEYISPFFKINKIVYNITDKFGIYTGFFQNKTSFSYSNFYIDNCKINCSYIKPDFFEFTFTKKAYRIPFGIKYSLDRKKSRLLIYQGMGLNFSNVKFEFENNLRGAPFTERYTKKYQNIFSETGIQFLIYLSPDFNIITDLMFFTDLKKGIGFDQTYQLNVGLNIKLLDKE